MVDLAAPDQPPEQVAGRRWDTIAVLLVLLLFGLFALAPDNDLPTGATPRDVDVLAVGLLVAAGLVLAVGGRRAPLTTFAFVLALVGLWHQLHYTNGIMNAAAMVAGFAVGITADRRRQIAAQLLGTVPLLVVVVIVERQSYENAIDGIGWTAVAILFGDLVANRRTLLDSYRQRAEVAEAESRRIVAEERLRTARDLHDLLAHTISIVNVQSAVAAEAVERHPDRVRAALDVIRSSSKQASREVNAMLTLLRHDVPVSHTPAPNLTRLAELADSGRQRGLTVHTDLAGVDEVAVSPLVALTAYRVAQEALTNTARHAHANNAWVTVTRNGTSIHVTVRDDGRADTDVPEGHGLHGMRERVQVVGGTLRHGPRCGGGFEVVATLPMLPAPSP